MYENGLHIAATHISTTDNKRIFYKTLEALDFVLNTNHEISLANYDNHYIMVFEFVTTQEASHDFNHPELTNRIFSVEFKFDSGLGSNVESLFMGERASTVSMRSARKITENNLMT